jgi:hypothetical protein
MVSTARYSVICCSPEGHGAPCPSTACRHQARGTALTTRNLPCFSVPQGRTIHCRGNGGEDKPRGPDRHSWTADWLHCGGNHLWTSEHARFFCTVHFGPHPGITQPDQRFAIGALDLVADVTSRYPSRLARVGVIRLLRAGHRDGAGRDGLSTPYTEHGQHKS